MKITFLKSLVTGNSGRCGLSLLALLFSIWFALAPGSAQSRNQKRITSLRVAEATEGSRVTVVSDTVLNDYEAFRRGDRFYVRIPFAEFGAGQPGFRGDGFEDVQVQKVGDSVVISFRLQPGATARVDQRSNRLDVIFAAPNRTTASNRSNSGFNRGTSVPNDGIVRINRSQTPQHRELAAGPMPPGSPGWPQATRARVVAERGRDAQTPRRQSVVSSPRLDSGREASNRFARNTGVSKSAVPSSRTETRAETPSRSPKSQSSATKAETRTNISTSGSSSTVSRYESSPVATPSTSPGYSALTTGTPATPVVSQPAVKSPGLNGTQSWQSRRDLALRWINANRQAALLGGLLLVGLLVFFALLLWRRKSAVKAKRSKATLAQPKYSPDATPNSTAANAPVNATAANMAPRTVLRETNPHPTTSEPGRGASSSSGKPANAGGINESAERTGSGPEPAMARSASVATASNQAWVPKSSSVDSSTSDDQEREVFEL